MVGLCEEEELQHPSMVARTSRVFCGVCGVCVLCSVCGVCGVCGVCVLCGVCGVCGVCVLHCIIINRKWYHLTLYPISHCVLVHAAVQ